MTKTLTTIGNSLGIIIEKPILDLLHIEKETLLEVRTDGRRLIIEPADKRRNRIKQATSRVMENHDRTLRKLAK